MLSKRISFKRLALGLVCVWPLLVGCQGTALPSAAFKTQKIQENLSAVTTLPAEAADMPSLLKRKNGDFFLVYQSTRRGQKVIYGLSSSDGQAWSTPLQITHQPLTAAYPQVVEDAEGHLNLFYSSNESGQWQIYTTQSTDGQAWSDPQSLTLPAQNLTAPSVQYDQKRYLLAYQSLQGGIFVTTSSDATQWAKPLQVSETGENPSLSKNHKGQQTLLFENASEEGWNLELTTSKNLKQWSQPQQITQQTRARWGRLVPGAQKDNVIFCMEKPEAGWEIYSQSSSDLTHWSEVTPLTQNGLRNTSPTFFSLGTRNLLLWSMGPLTTARSPVLALTQVNL